MSSAHALPRSERLRSLGAVRRVFESGESGFVFPFRYVWYAEPDAAPSVEVLFSVPKRFHKRANRRNLLRRRTKEAYRLHKQLVGTGGRRRRSTPTKPSNAPCAAFWRRSTRVFRTAATASLRWIANSSSAVSARCL